MNFVCVFAFTLLSVGTCTVYVFLFMCDSVLVRYGVCCVCQACFMELVCKDIGGKAREREREVKDAWRWMRHITNKR